MKRSLLLVLFMLTTPFVIGASLVSLTLFPLKPLDPVLPAISVLPAQVYAALPENSIRVNNFWQTADARPLIIRKYLERYDSPLKPYADLIVKASDENRLDWRLLVAIAQQESNLGKKIPENSYNAWGWGVHSRGTLRFTSWEEGIVGVANGLKERYVDEGFTTADEIMAKYCPLSNGSWASGVNQFLEELETGEID
ncbi:MAG: hypothetical protein ABH807_01270 [Candidatus Shapirobacteria bacterium]